MIGGFFLSTLLTVISGKRKNKGAYPHGVIQHTSKVRRRKLRPQDVLSLAQGHKAN